MMKESTRLALIISGVILTGLLLMTATGLTVYFGFCVNQPVTNTTSDTSQLIVCNCSLPPPCPVTRLCPEEAVEPCPLHPIISTTFDPNTCLTPCQPECHPRNCLLTPPPDCRTTTTTQTPHFRLTDEQMMNQTVLEWVMAYPPNSYGRLQVLTQLMEFGDESYVRVMTRRNCKHPFRICTICRDRYQFLRCAMKMKVTANKFGYKNTNKLSRMDPKFAENYAYLSIKQAEFYNRSLDYSTAEGLIGAYRAFWFISDDGSQCTWCQDDEDAAKQIRCIWQGSLNHY